MVTVLPVAPPMVRTTGTAFPVGVLVGTSTSTWWRPTKPGADPENVTKQAVGSSAWTRPCLSGTQHPSQPLVRYRQGAKRPKAVVEGNILKVAHNVQYVAKGYRYPNLTPFHAITNCGQRIAGIVGSGSLSRGPGSRERRTKEAAPRMTRLTTGLLMCFAVVVLTVPAAAGLYPFTEYSCAVITCPGAPLQGTGTFEKIFDETGARTVTNALLGTFEESEITLPSWVYSGGVAITEPVTGALSDILWIPGYNNSLLVIDSDVGGVLPQALLPYRQPLSLSYEESGSEGFNGIVYHAGLATNLGGYGVNTYVFYSDGSVPEPGTLLLLGTGLLGAAGFIRRRIAG